LSSVESLTITCKDNPGASKFFFFVSRVSENLTSLRSFVFIGARVNEETTECFRSFFRKLPRDQLHHMHIAGLPSLQLAGLAIESQKNSLRQLRANYFVTGHGTTVDAAILPVLPKIKDLAFDVADLSEIKAEHMVKLLKGIENQAEVENLYLPHVQVLGNLDDLRPVVEELGRIAKWKNIKQIVIRFHSLVLPLSEFLALREALEFLPACCLSRSFIVALEKWASWWPPITEMWKNKQQLTGRALFREQIDFGSLGICADREWLRLPRGRKDFWNKALLPTMHALLDKY
jgi:hypothetical protein